jgi:hypothetical protein
MKVSHLAFFTNVVRIINNADWKRQAWIAPGGIWGQPPLERSWEKAS